MGGYVPVGGADAVTFIGSAALQTRVLATLCPTPARLDLSWKDAGLALSFFLTWAVYRSPIAALQDTATSFYPFRRLSERIKVAKSVSGSKGLIKNSDIPASKQRALSSAKALAVMAMIGV